jgi:chromosome segregation ATPase
MSNQNLYDQYYNQIQENNRQFQSALSDFKTIYVNYYNNPDAPDNQTLFNNSIHQLQQINNNNRDLFNTIKSQIDSNNTSISEMDQGIQTVKQENSELKTTYIDLQDTKSASESLIKDYKSMYNQQLIMNTQIFVGIMLLSFGCFSVFKR